MTLDEAREHIGSKVIYCDPVPGFADDDEGVIVRVSEHYVFVRYGSDYGAEATPAGRLTLLSAT